MGSPIVKLTVPALVVHEDIRRPRNVLSWSVASVSCADVALSVCCWHCCSLRWPGEESLGLLRLQIFKIGGGFAIHIELILDI